ncbi:MAG: SRPBCC family protein [Saccharospirillaceae bacterium]|nr:SRPBCC family protein [Pseudomonadales bacterium]NRB80989.1 SRPBCC family protein [Saccharospirillaceae bacterium]
MINSSKQTAWLLLSEFDNVYKWIPNISSSKGQGLAKVGVGHGRHCVIDGFGAIDETITLWSEGEGVEFEISPLGPLYGATSRWELTENSNGQTVLTVTLVYSVRFGLFGKMLHSLMMRKKLADNLGSILNTVKHVLEDKNTSSELFSKAVVA